VGVEGQQSDFDYGTCPKVWVAFNPETLSKIFDPLRSDMKTHQQFGCAMHRTPKNHGLEQQQVLRLRKSRNSKKEFWSSM